MKISLIQPSRNNLKYLKWSYESIRKNQGDHEVEICIADDFSDKDNTWEWCQQTMKRDPLFKAIRNEGPTRLGHTILYDTLVNDVASNDICMIYHADMYLCPGALDAIEFNMFDTTFTGDAIYKDPKEKVIVSLTRIEPPLHPDGPEKLLQDFGIEPEEFKEEALLNYVKEHVPVSSTTEGIFAPWAFWKKDFQEIGGHDVMFAPQSKEDTDIFNRFHLNGIKFIQTWRGFVYHMTCRGSRFADGAERNPNGEVFMKNRETDEWLTQNQKSTREFIRKWGHFCKHDALMKPIVPPKYDIGICIKNCSNEVLGVLEPWCNVIYTDANIDTYISKESSKTSFDLSARVKNIDSQYTQGAHDIILEMDASRFYNTDMQVIEQISEIISDSADLGEFELGNIKLFINNLSKYEKDLIICKN